MKTTHLKNFKLGAIAILSGTALLLTSCYVPYGGYYTGGTYSAGGDTMVDWVDASYDVNGYPIYGYSYGRPVYGYTDAGVAIFTIAALTALCYIPNWGPASWYHGHYHRGPGRPYAQPPHYAPGHHPQNRPKGGMNADVHRNPTKYTHKGGSGSHNNNRPGASSSHNNNRPGASSSHSTRPSSSSHSRVTSSHKSTASRVHTTARSTGSRTHSSVRTSISRSSASRSGASHGASHAGASHAGGHHR